MEDTPEDCKSFLSMMIEDDGSMYKMEEKVNPHTDVAIMPYSSGTTGPPKGVCLSHYNIVANCVQTTSPEVSDVRCVAPPPSSNTTCFVVRALHEIGHQDSVL